RQFTSDAELGHLPEQLVFNCTGLGSRALFGDHELRPARGQLAVLLPQPEVQYAFSGNAGYMFPRSDGIILGGTFELDNWSIEPDEATTQSIIASHEKLFGNFRCSGAPLCGQSAARSTFTGQSSPTNSPSRKAPSKPAQEVCSQLGQSLKV